MDSILTGYGYLQPPVEVNLIQHNPNYIKTGFKETAQRRIFYAVPLDDFELSKIQELEAVLNKKGVRLPPGWNERETLRYIYGAKFDMETAIANIQLSLRWRGTRNNHIIPEEATKLLESGAVYTYGRDTMFRPVVIIDCGKLNIQNLDVENFQVALITLLDILKEYCFVPGRVENWIVILDTRRINFFQFPSKELSPIKTLLTACYPLTLERLLIVNSSESVFSSWKSIESLVDQATLKKITILEPSEMGKLLSILPRNQLEAKFGGSLPDLTKFWIPRVPFSNLSPTKTTSNNSNLESSLARLSQQIESVEGKFQKILTPDHKFRSSQTPSPNIQAHSTVSPGRTSGFPEPRNYPIGYSNNQAQASLQSPYEREKQLEKEKRSSFPIREYEEVPRVRTQVTPGVTEYYAETYQYQRNNEDVPKRSYQPQANGDQGEQKAPESQAESTEQSVHYDFNDDKLIDLILNENDALLTGKVENKPAIVRTTINQTEQVTRSGNYRNDANRQEVFKTIPRSTAGDKQKAFSEYYTQPDRRTYNASTTTSTYVTREYSTAQPNPRFVQGKTEYEIPKSSLPVEQGYPSTMRASQTTSGGQYEEWNPQKYAKKKDDEIDELESEADFCGLCVKSRKKEKTAKV